MDKIEEFARERISKIKVDRSNLDFIANSGKINGSLLLSLIDLSKDISNFAQRWIPIEEELPEDSDILVHTEKHVYTKNPVLVRTANGRHTVSKRSKFKGNENGKWEWIGSSTFSYSVTHWRPI